MRRAAREGLSSVLLWSAISAAFIGPGTVTTAGAAGTGYGLALLWALVLSTVACLCLQEASARLTLATGKELGQALLHRWGRGWAWLAASAVVLGCAAFEAGNLLGAHAGLRLLVPAPAAPVAIGLGALVAVLLASSRPAALARLLGGLVALMGLCFIACALADPPAFGALLRGALRPSLPTGSAALALGLVGTTVVPYNLFLGSGLARGESLGRTRFGLAVAIPLGGLISAAVMISAAGSAGDFSYARLASHLGRQVGAWAEPAFAVGLFAAGLSSALTAPLAAGLVLRSLAPRRGRVAHAVGWVVVLVTGVACAAAGLRPVPVIIAAQALNGLVLPLAAVFLLLAVNDARAMGARRSGALSNVVGVVSVGAALVLGMRTLVGAFRELLQLMA